MCTLFAKYSGSWDSIILPVCTACPSREKDIYMADTEEIVWMKLVAVASAESSITPLAQPGATNPASGDRRLPASLSPTEAQGGKKKTVK